MRPSGRHNEEEKLTRLKHEDLKTTKAYHLKLTFLKFWEQETPGQAKAFLDDWYYWATHNQIPDMVKAAKTIRQHESGILRWVYIQSNKRRHGSHKRTCPKCKTTCTRLQVGQKPEYDDLFDCGRTKT